MSKSISIRIEDVKITTEAVNGIGRIDYAYDGYEAEKIKLGIL